LSASKSKTTKTRTVVSQNPFQTGADVLKINVDALVTIYDKTISVVDTMIKSGKTNAASTWFGILIYADLLHGGRYTVPINNLPYYVGSASEYYPGNLSSQSTPQAGIIDLITSFIAGTGPDPTQQYREVLMDANVPHILPKLLSDEAYGLLKMGLIYQGGSGLFTDAAKGLSTLVEAESKLISAEGQAIGSAARGIGQGAASLAPLLSLLGAGA
jgi:hypothetical protein